MNETTLTDIKVAGRQLKQNTLFEAPIKLPKRSEETGPTIRIISQTKIVSGAKFPVITEEEELTRAISNIPAFENNSTYSLEDIHEDEDRLETVIPFIREEEQGNSFIVIDTPKADPEKRPTRPRRRNTVSGTQPLRKPIQLVKTRRKTISKEKSLKKIIEKKAKKSPQIQMDAEQIIAEDQTEQSPEFINFDFSPIPSPEETEESISKKIFQKKTTNIYITQKEQNLFDAHKKLHKDDLQEAKQIKQRIRVQKMLNCKKYIEEYLKKKK